MKSKIKFLTCLFVLCLIVILPSMTLFSDDSYVPQEGFVPNGLTAAEIAEAILVPIYGSENINKQKPFKVKLKNNIWYVSGVLSPDFVGGVATVEISKKDARILKVSHGK